MTKSSKKVLGVWAGEGLLPVRIAANALKERPVVVVAFREFSDIPALRQTGAKIHVISIGQMGLNLSLLRKEHVSELVMIGKFQKKIIFGQTKLDLTGLRMVLKLANHRDMSVFKVLSSELDRIGIRVISQSAYLPEFLSTSGAMTRTKPSREAMKDISYGTSIARKMAEHDIGQTIVVCHGSVVSVEAYEGTNAAIGRVPDYLGKRSVVIKAARLRQDFRFDIPTVGTKTLELMRGKNIKILALEAGKTMIAEKDDFIKYADKNHIAVYGF